VLVALATVVAVAGGITAALVIGHRPTITATSAPVVTTQVPATTQPPTTTSPPVDHRRSDSAGGDV